MQLKFKIKNYPETAKSWIPNLLQATSEIKPAATVGLTDTAILEVSTVVRDTIQAIEVEVFSKVPGSTSLSSFFGYKTIWTFPNLEDGGLYTIDYLAATMAKESTGVDPGPDPDPNDGSGGILNNIPVVPVIIAAVLGLIALAKRR